MVGGAWLTFLLALAGWGASQVRYEPPASVGGLSVPPSLADEMEKAFASFCQPAVMVLLNMAVMVAVGTAVRWLRAMRRPASGPAGGAPAGPAVPQSAEVRAHAHRQSEGPAPHAC